MKLITLLRTEHERSHASGQIAVTLALLVPFLIGLLGLVVDGGLMMVQYRRGQVAVDSAALAAATQLDEATFLADNRVQLDSNLAHAAALQYGQENGGGHVAITGVSVSDRFVTVSGQVTARTVFLQLLGVPSVRLSVWSRAELKYGITEEGQ